MTASSVADSDDQHWPNDGEYLKNEPSTIAGYDSHNGIRSHIYVPAKEDESPSPVTPKAATVIPQPQVLYNYYSQYQQMHPQMMAYPQMQYTYAPQPMMHPPTAGYYPYAQQAVPMIYQPAPVEYKAPTQYKAPKPTKWQGRSKREVEEDNMKIAAREGAYDKRKVQPVGVKDAQMMWCIETDGSQTLRAFVSIKELKGKWMKDPRFEDSYYFVREEEKED